MRDGTDPAYDARREFYTGMLHKRWEDGEETYVDRLLEKAYLVAASPDEDHLYERLEELDDLAREWLIDLDSR